MNCTSNLNNCCWFSNQCCAPCRCKLSGWGFTTASLHCIAFAGSYSVVFLFFLHNNNTFSYNFFCQTNRLTFAMSILFSGERSYDKLLGGLLADGFDERSCHSRYQSAMYRRRPGRQPSAYLVSKLRRQEALQRRCGPGTVAYSNALEQLRSGRSGGGDIVASPECKYLVSISYGGLGNQILPAASAFLYTLLTERVLLVDPSNEMGELFCEPFPGTTWLLPSAGFPLASYTNFSVSTAESYGNMLRNKVLRTDGVTVTEMPAFSYVHLDHDATEQDRFFFCDDDQRVLWNIRWLVMRTDNYVVPAGAVPGHGVPGGARQAVPGAGHRLPTRRPVPVPPQQQRLGLVTRYYDGYLAGATQLVGIQARIFGAQPNSPELLEQITKCTQKERLLPVPELLTAAAAEPLVPEPARKTKAVLVTSLKSWYYEKVKGMYWEHAAATGERAPAGVAALRRQVARRQGVGRDVPAEPDGRAGDHGVVDVRVRGGAGARRPDAVGDVPAGQRHPCAGSAVRTGRVHGAVLPRAAVL